MTKKATGELGWKDVPLAKEKMLFPRGDQTYPRTIWKFKFTWASGNALIGAASCKCGIGNYQIIWSEFFIFSIRVIAFSD